MEELNIREEIDKKLQIVLTLSIFLPPFLSTFYDAGGLPKEQLNRINLSWSILVAIFLVDYIIFSTSKRDRISVWFYTAINTVLLATIGLFIIPIVLMATTVPSQPPSFLNTVAAHISLVGLPLAPILVALLFLIGSIAGDFRGRRRKKSAS